MRAFYEAWWAELEPTFTQTTEIHIGHPDAPKVRLTAHDWIDVPHSPPWNQAQIRWGGKEGRGGKYDNARFQGHWAVKVIESGTYDIHVRRYPDEAHTPIRAAMPAGENVPGASKAYRCSPGLAFPFSEAVLRIDGKELARKPVDDRDTAITFTTELKTGSIRLAPVFVTEKGGEIGVYYATVVRK